MGFLRNFLIGRRKLAVQALCFALVALLAATVPAAAVEPVDTLPHVARWVNGMAVSHEGVYLSDTWAVDDTGVTTDGFVLLDQGCMEIMRVAQYPEDVTGNETTPCEKYTMTIALDVPEGTSGSVNVVFENAAAVYTVSFFEADGYCGDVLFYPGVYEITEVELTGDLSSDYVVGNMTELDIGMDASVTLEVVEAEANGGEGNGNAGEPSDGQEPGQDGSVEDTEAPTEEEEKSDLLFDFILLLIGVVVLLAILAIVKRAREKKEELYD